MDWDATYSRLYLQHFNFFNWLLQKTAEDRGWVCISKWSQDWGRRCLWDSRHQWVHSSITVHLWLTCHTILYYNQSCQSGYFFVLSVYLDCFPFGSFFECKRCLEHFRLKSKCSDILFLVRACHVPERPVAHDPHLVVWIITTTHYRRQEGCYWQQNNSNFGDVLDYLLDPGFFRQLNNYRK